MIDIERSDGFRVSQINGATADAVEYAVDLSCVGSDTVDIRVDGAFIGRVNDVRGRMSAFSIDRIRECANVRAFGGELTRGHEITGRMSMILNVCLRKQSCMRVIYSIDTIVSEATVSNGQPIIAGSHVRVLDIVSSHLYRGLSADELAVNFALDLGQIYAALAYYYQHKSAMDTLIRLEVERTDQLLNELEAQGKLMRVE